MRPRVVITGGAAAFPIRDFLTRANVPFEYLDGEGPIGVAMCTLADGTRLESPTLGELARHLGLMTTTSTAMYDLVIVGGGPAGLAAAVYAASEGLATAVVEREVPGGQAGTSTWIENYLGFPEGISGIDLAERARDQAAKFGADMLLLREATADGVVDGRAATCRTRVSRAAARCGRCRETRTRSRRPDPGCSQPATSGEAPRSASRRRSAKARWPSSSCTASSPSEAPRSAGDC